MIRLLRLDLTRWGNFSDRALDFGAAEGRLHLVHGSNAAGKSTARRAVGALLFGIPSRTQDAHTHGYADLRIGALLSTDSGRVEVVRRKGTVNTLLGPDGLPLGDDPMAAALNGLTADAYAGLFEVSHESLVEGGRELLAGHGAVGESLFAAAAGTGRLHDLLHALDSEAEALFKPRGRNDPLNTALGAHAKAIKDLHAATVRPTRAAEMRRDLCDAEGRIEKLDGEIRALDEEAGRLGRLKAVKPMLARHGALVSEREGLGDPPALEVNAEQRRSAAQHERDEAARAIRESEEALEVLRQKRAGHAEPGELIGRAAEVRAVHAEIAAVRKAADDRRKLEGGLHREDARLAEQLARIGPGMSASDLEAHRGRERTRRTLERCLAGRGEIVERRRGARDRVKQGERELKVAQGTLSAMPPAVDAASLRAAVRAAAKAGPLERQAADHRASAEASRAEAAARFGRLRPRPEDLDTLLGRPTPSAEAADRFANASRTIDGKQAALDRDRERAEAEALDLEERRARLRAGGEAPSAADLAEARARRGEDWKAVRAALAAPAEDAESRADRLEGSMAGADRIADARTAGADSLAQAAELDVAAARLEAMGLALDERADELERERAQLEADWRSAWDGSGTSAPAILDARAWLAERERICALQRDGREAEGRAAAAEEAANAHRRSVSERLEDLGAGPPARAALEELIALGESAADDLDALAATRQRAQDVVDRGERDLDEQRAELAEAEASEAEWGETWASLCGDYGIEPPLEADDATEVLQAIGDALVAADRAADLRHRIEGIDRDRREFAGAVSGLCAALAPDLSGAEPVTAAESLMERLETALRAREALDALESQIEQEEAGLADALRRRDAAREEIEGMLEAARVADEGDLPGVERRAGRAAELRQEIPRCEREVAEAGERSFETLSAEASRHTAEEIGAQIAELDRRRAGLRELRDAAQQDAFAARSELDRAERSDSAGRAAEEAQQHLAAARGFAERYAVARLSSRILRDAIERYRARHQGPMLERANALFPLLTRETFTELYPEWDDAGEPVLVGRETGGRSLRVEQMSDGTREQLFLALRIAAIERYVESSGAVPVLFDDVFLESDDPRSERILRALADLAARTQVIVLTHHRHLVEIAQRVVDPERLALHDLDAPSARETEIRVSENRGAVPA